MISVSAYAKHRGCDRSAVYRAISSGRLVHSLRMIPGGGYEIDADLADKEWAQSTTLSVGDRRSEDFQVTGVHPRTHLQAADHPIIPAACDEQATGKVRGKDVVVGAARSGRFKKGSGVLFFLRPSVKIKKDWPFVATVERVAQKELPRQYRNALAKAVKSRRR